ncbi:Ribokinase-like protein [Multifurca ochricompacta]|uniref:pyridoxal kinase n=1 Tax=Multifurca ochricompacta TaxID=376703 RepID=A0AAD4LZ64_9AGAM|nr:Ribokinase-like protein [Multifurca ochricompacta]
MAVTEDLGRILSIQSHVTYGYVGGKAATFPLQLLGYDVDIINTVNFSNHSGYHRFDGTKATADELDNIFSVLEKNGFLQPARVLTGFIFGAEALRVVARSVTKLLENAPQSIYLLDPVMGDAGRLYVSPDVIPIYRSLLPKATIITPNWFEVETITETKIEDKASLQKALTILHETYSVPNVVISSIPVEKWLRDLTPSYIRSAVSDKEPSLLCLASTRAVEGNVSRRGSVVYAGYVPLIPGYFSGVGDLFSALVLGHYFPLQSPSDSSRSSSSLPPLPHAVSLALTKTHAILRLTEQYSSSLPPDDHTVTDDELDNLDPERRIRRMRGRELRLIQGRRILSGETMGEPRSLKEWEDFWKSN